MRIGEVLSARKVEQYLREQLSQVEQLQKLGYNHIIAYPVTSSTFINGYAITYIPVRVLCSALVRYKLRGSYYDNKVEKVRVRIGKPLDVPARYLPEGFTPQTICRCVATDGTYVFVKADVNGKSKWFRLGEIERRSK